MAHFDSDFHESNMRAVCVFMLLVVALCSDALNCRSNAGPKENELKSIYTNCLKRQSQQGRDYSRNKSYGDDDWRDPRAYNKRDRDRPTSQWDMDHRDDNQRDRPTKWDRDGRRNDRTDDYDDKTDDGRDRDDRSNNRDDRMYKNVRQSNRDGRISNRDEIGWGDGGNNRYGRDNRNNEKDERNNGNDRMYNRDMGNDRIYGRIDTNQGINMMYNRGDMSRMNNRDDRMYSRNDRTNKGDEMNGNERMGNRDERISEDRMGRHGYGVEREQVSRRDDMSGGEFGSDFSSQYSMSSNQFPHRYKREQRLGAGQRSKYNPHASSPRPSGYEESYRNYDKNSSDGTNKTSDKIKACALHCFIENLEMTGDNGMPDKYLVTHVITKDVQNEDLRDFLQESIEECFQILDNENTEDKCEFSKNLLLCLSEKGRANCDDWKDDIQF